MIKQLNNEKNTNEKLNKKIIELENEIKKEKSKIKDLEEEVKQLKKVINESENNKKFLENLNIKDFCKIILEKDKEIKDLKNKLSRFPLF